MISHQAGSALRRVASILVLCAVHSATPAEANPPHALTPGRAELDPRIEADINKMLAKMTLEEKVGQLNFPSLAFPQEHQYEHVRKGRIGGMLNVVDPALVTNFRQAAEKSRLEIPLIFAIDAIHAFRISFPVPIAWAATWEPALAEEAAEAIARETAESGVNMTFAPMVDISRDPRWGRVIEGAGEDALLGAEFAAARVRGYRKGGLATAAKHFVGYGAGEGGRDYNGAQISTGELLDRYVPPFEAAIAAGTDTVMASFNTINGVPVTANREIVTELLKERLGFTGLVMSDFAGISELINHEVAGDLSQAARKAITAGIDLDMQGKAYDDALAAEVTAGRVPMAAVDDAVRRVLRTKHRMGLFRPPAQSGASLPTMAEAEVRRRAREVARQSFVLLQNANSSLPIGPDVKVVALIGAAATSTNDHSWFGPAQLEKPATETLQNALAQKLAARGQRLTFVEGFSDPCAKSFANKSAAIEAARAADLVVLIVAEDCGVSGEGISRTNLDLSGVQQEMLDALSAVGRPIVLVVETGRPLTLARPAQQADSILIAWHPGTEGRTALAEVLTGEIAPSGKLPMTFPRSVGQIPLTYNELPTSRPSNGTRYTTGYVDEQITPLYPFGHGMSYTAFSYSDLEISRSSIASGEPVEISVLVSNAGRREGREVVQLYTRQLVAGRSPPVRELKGFKKILLPAGERTRVTFTLEPSDLIYHDRRGQTVLDPGTFKVYVGGSSLADLSGQFEVKGP